MKLYVVYQENVEPIVFVDEQQAYNYRADIRDTTIMREISIDNPMSMPAMPTTKVNAIKTLRYLIPWLSLKEGKDLVEAIMQISPTDGPTIDAKLDRIIQLLTGE